MYYASFPSAQKERRQYPRINVKRVTVEIYTAKLHIAAPDFCQIVNISESGMLLLSSLSYLPEQKVRLTFVLPSSSFVIRTDAKIVHVTPENDLNSIGTHFLSIQQQDRHALREFVEKNQTDLSA